ncbi:MAG: hypothetical protein HZA89_12375 [Verrucomicrobia bacterium]|nr:hypothetical protein [Verrucomicrobiota bacterium]
MNAENPNPAPPAVISQPAAPPRRSRWWKWALGAFGAVVALVVLLVVVLALSLDSLARNFIRRSIEEATGMKTELAKLELHFREPGLHVEGFRLANPAEFGGGAFIDLPELTLTLDRAALSERKLHFKLARVNVAEVHVAVSQDGRTNYVEMQRRGAERRAEQEKAGKAKPKKDGPQFEKLDRLEFSFAMLRYTNLREPERNRALNLGLKDVVIENIRDKAEFGTQLVLAVTTAGIDVLNLLSGGLDNLPDKAR